MKASSELLFLSNISTRLATLIKLSDRNSGFTTRAHLFKFTNWIRTDFISPADLKTGCVANIIKLGQTRLELWFFNRLPWQQVETRIKTDASQSAMKQKFAIFNCDPLGTQIELSLLNFSLPFRFNMGREQRKRKRKRRQKRVLQYDHTRYSSARKQTWWRKQNFNLIKRLASSQIGCKSSSL